MQAMEAVDVNPMRYLSRATDSRGYNNLVGLEIQITDQQGEIKADIERIETKARKILDALAYRESELSIVLVDDAEMSLLNWRYRRRRGPTNVLSFAMREGEFG